MGGHCDPSFGVDFSFDAHEKELIVGDIFVRVYNEQPTFPIEEPKKFAQALLDYLGSKAEEPQQTITGTTLEDCIQALKALSNIINSNPGIETTCIGHFKLL